MMRLQATRLMGQFFSFLAYDNLDKKLTKISSPLFLLLLIEVLNYCLGTIFSAHFFPFSEQIEKGMISEKEAAARGIRTLDFSATSRPCQPLDRHLLIEIGRRHEKVKSLLRC